MAVRNASLLGLHRVSAAEEIFSDDNLILGRKLWKSLFVLDNFLATSLGRPTTIFETDFAEDSLVIPSKLPSIDIVSENRHTDELALDATVQSCQIMANILGDVYTGRKISTAVAQDYASDCETWSKNVHFTLDPAELLKEGVTHSQGTAILHVQLFGHHSRILLTRPFFLSLWVQTLQSPIGKDPFPQSHSRKEELSRACVVASIETISLLQTAFKAKQLPRRNPFAL